MYQNYLLEETVAQRMSHKKAFLSWHFYAHFKAPHFYLLADFYEIWRHISLISNTLFCTKKTRSEPFTCVLYGLIGFAPGFLKMPISIWQSRVPLAEENFFKTEQGPGVWKMNVATIHSAQFRESITYLWSTWKSNIADYRDILIW